MIFKHTQTGRDAVYIAPYDSSWKNQDDPNLFRVKHWHDIPQPLRQWCDHTTIAPEIWELQGAPALYYWFGAFLKEAHPKYEGDFWLLIMGSGYPGGKLEIVNNPEY